MKSHKFLFVLAVLMIALAQFMTAPAPVAAATLCDAAQFVADVTIPDGTLMQPGQAFTKTWRLKNIGSCAWETTYKLAFSSGESMGAATASQLASKVAPGQTIDITLNMTAPSVAGTYRSNWVLKNASGTAFGIGAAADKPFYVEIRVASSAGTGYDFAANAANANWSSGAGTLTFPGTDGDAKGFGLKLDTPKLETGTVDSSAGLLMFPQNTFNGYIQAQYPAFTVQSGDRFQSIINCEYNATSCYVNFRLDYQIGSNPVKTYWSFNEKYEGLYYRADLDLSALAGQDVKFILRVGTAGFATGDRALWGAPRIVRGMGGGTVTPSLTPSPTAIGPTKTPTPTSSISTCDRVSFVADVSVPDGMNFNPGTTFTKTWRLKNVGTCTWSTAYTLVFVSGDKLGGPDASALPQAVAPGQTIDISVPLTAPAATGTYRGYWQFKNAAGALFGIGANFDKPWWVDIRVVSGTLVPTFTPTATKTPTPTVTGPTKTPTPTSSVSTCDRVSFVADVSVPDGMNFNPGTTFTKTWRLKNVGTCTWSTAYTLVFVSGDKLGGPDASALPQAVAPGQTIDISVPLTAPAATGTYRGYWQFKNAAGALFGIGANFDKPWWVDIRVVSGTLVPTFTPTATKTPTPTVTGPTKTPTPTSSVSTCDRVSFVADVSVPDGMNFNPGTTFTKTWRLKNVGTCTWSTAYTLVFVSGDKLGGPDASALPQAVAPGQTIDISVPLTAPAATGTYRGYWQFKNATGLLFGIGAKFDKPWWVDIRVVGPTATPSITLTPTATTTPATATPTRTPTPTGQPVTLGYDFAANASSANWSSGAGALPFPGADGDARGFAIKFDTVQIETGGTDNSGAILTVPQNIYNGYIRGVYPAYSVKSGDKFQVMLGCQYSATLCYITYQLDYEENSVVKTFWSFSEKYEGQVYNASVDLSPLAGKTVKFILAVSAAGNATGDRALWVGPRISSSTGATTPTPTATPATTSWALYENPHGFSFKIPYPPNINAESPQKVHLTLPITAGTNLSEKYIDLVVTENASSCKTTLSGEDATKQQTVTFNGFSFNKQAGGDAGAGNYYTWSAYSTWRGTTCISMGFVLHSTNAANYPTPPPLFNETAESAVFTMIMDSFRLYYGPYAVMDVTTNDVLNIRAGAGTSNPVVASFPYNATNVTRTGPTSMISGSKWVEVKTPSNSLGWVNSFYLTEYVDKTAFCADSKIALLLADLKSAITTSDGDKFSGLVSPIHGVDIYNAAGGKRNTFTPALAQTAFTSTTSYDWGAAPASGLPVSGSFKDVILPKMLDVFNNAGYATYCETPKAGAVNWDGVWGGEYANIRYYSLNRPGELDWRTWVAGIEYIDAKPYVTVLMQFQWEP